MTGFDPGDRPHRLLWLTLVLLTTGCVTPPPPGTPPRPAVGFVSGDARVSQYGATGADVLNHPSLAEAVSLLFGPDWARAPGAKTSAAAAEFFSQSSPPHLLHVGTADYLAVRGCIASRCATHQGLLLVRTDGGELLGRLDEGGYTHYYGRGLGLEMTPATRAVLDAAWRALTSR